ncbi:MAG: SCP2 sterol-binding domain-containing protein [Polyangiales bacterium]
MPVNVTELFNTTLANALANNPEGAKKIGGTYGLNITGEGGGNWKIDLASATPTVAQSDAPIGDAQAQVVITVAESDFQTLVGDPGAGMKLFFAGKLKVKGNQMLAMKLKDLFALR